MPFFTEWSGASSFEVILARQSRHSTTGTLASKTSGSRRISHILPRERTWRRFGCVDFARLLISYRKLQLSPFEHCPLAFHCQQSPGLLFTLFCPLILDHGVLLKISASGPKVLISNFLFDTSFHHSFQSVIIRSIQFQYGLDFFRLSYS